jgi:hypothetical protein
MHQDNEESLQQQAPEQYTSTLCVQSKAHLPLASQMLPLELKWLIVQMACTPKKPCLDFITKGYDGCLDPWSCKLSHLGPEDTSFYTVKPNITSVCSSFRHEAYKTFYQNNTFVFRSTGGDQAVREGARPGEAALPWEDLRDPYASRILEFIDRPEWKNKGSRFFKDDVRYQPGDKYRHLISSIIINVEPNWGSQQHRDWDWPLKIDWSTLPHLKSLQLDLRTYSRRPSDDSEEAYNERLEAGAVRMRCLNLDRLVLFGLCSFDLYWGDVDHKRRMETLFRPAVRPGGKLEFWDQQSFVRW